MKHVALSHNQSAMCGIVDCKRRRRCRRLRWYWVMVLGVINYIISVGRDDDAAPSTTTNYRFPPYARRTYFLASVIICEPNTITAVEFGARAARARVCATDVPCHDACTVGALDNVPSLSCVSDPSEIQQRALVSFVRVQRIIVDFICHCLMLLCTQT